MKTRVSLKQTKRKILVDATIQYAGDEYETFDDFLNLAKMSEQELFKNLQSIRDYFTNQNNDDIQYELSVYGNLDNFIENTMEKELNYIIEFVLTHEF